MWQPRARVDSSAGQMCGVRRARGGGFLRVLVPDLKMRGYTAGKTERFKSLNLSEFPSAANVGTFGPPRARGPTRLAASVFHVHLQFHL